MRLLKDEEILKVSNEKYPPSFVVTDRDRDIAKAQYNLCIKDFMTMLKSGHSIEYIMVCLDSS